MDLHVQEGDARIQSLSEQEPQQSIRVVAPQSAPPPRFTRRTVQGRQRAEHQMWTNRRFRDITAADFHPDGIAVFTFSKLAPPSGFEDSWYAVDYQQDPALLQQVHQMQTPAAILLLADAEEQQQVNCFCMIDWSQVAMEQRPPVFWVLHGKAGQGHSFECIDPAALKQAIDNGIDDVICSESVGSQLVLAVRVRIQKCVLLRSKLKRSLQQRRDMRRDMEVKSESLQDNISNVLWEYLFTRHGRRLFPNIPNVDPAYPPVPQSIDGMLVDERLGGGANGEVWSLKAPGGGPSGMVVKRIDKKSISSVAGIQSIDNEIKIMTLLTKQWPHPNIVKFKDAIHTNRYFLFRMEAGGNLNLCRCLRDCEESLSEAKAVTLVQQIIQAVEHMHSTCSCVHLDIKPENICVQETDQNIILKLIDFDAAMIASAQTKCTKIHGTFPFTAPEVFLQNSHKVFPTDIWSLGVVLCEIICGVCILEHILEIPNLKRHQKESKMIGVDVSLEELAASFSRKMANHFRVERAVSKLVDEHSRSHLHTFAMSLKSMLAGMVCTSVESRYSATRILHLFQGLMLEFM